MPLVTDPGSLTALIETPVGSVIVPISAGNAFNDLFRAWTEFQRQTAYVLPRRLNRATYYRARLKLAVKV